MSPAPSPLHTGFNRAQHRVRLETAGCRVNKYDSAVIRAELAARGYALAEADEAFDTLILNSCTVTAASDHDTRRYLRRIRREHPRATLVVTGCYAEVAADEIARELEVDLVVGNREKALLVDRLDAWLGLSPNSVISDTSIDFSIDALLTPVVRPLSAPAVEAIPDPGGHTRFFFKIQEGCDVRCAFCIIPDARGASRSLQPDEVVSTVRKATARGYREVILAGIHLGGYGRDLPDRFSLTRLLRRVLDETPVERLRLGSLEPWGLRPELIDLVREEPRLLPSFHLPLQSGSEATLQAMGRPITARRYRRLVEALQEARPGLTLWIDAIVGFPGETEAHFQESLDFISSLDFTRLHVFPYSIRPGTPAAELSGHLDEPTKRERANRLLALSEERQTAWLRRRVGETDEVLVELGGRGHTRDNLPIQLIDPEKEALRGQVLPVRLTGVAGDRLTAERVLEV